MRVVCAGGSALGGVLGEPDIAQLRQAQVRDGAVQISVSRDAEVQGRENCEHRVERLPVAAVAPVAPMACDVQQVMVDSVCWGVPKPELERYKTRWVLPDCPGTGSGPCEALLIDTNNEEYQPGHWYDFFYHEVSGRRVSGGPAQPLAFRGYRNQGDIGGGYRPFDGPEAVGLASTSLRWRLPVRVSRSRPGWSAVGWSMSSRIPRWCARLAVFRLRMRETTCGIVSSWNGWCNGGLFVKVRVVATGAMILALRW